MKPASPRYNLLVFDFDGTLVDTAVDIAWYANQVLVEYGFPAKSLPEVKKAIGRGVKELFRDLGLAVPEAELEAASASFKKRYFDVPVRETKPYPWVVEMLSGPLAGVKKAINTNKPQQVTDRILADLGLAPFFEAVIGDGAGFPRKPDPTSMCHLMNLAGARPDETVLIGDSVVDHQTALLAKTGFVWVDWGYDSTLSRHDDLIRVSSAREWSALAPPTR